MGRRRKREGGRNVGEERHVAWTYEDGGMHGGERWEVKERKMGEEEEKRKEKKGGRGERKLCY